VLRLVREQASAVTVERAAVESADPPGAVAAWLDLMELRPTGRDCFDAPQPDPGPTRTFGGQLLAQGLRAAALTVPTHLGAVPARLHAEFIAPGSGTEALTYRVERIAETRSTAWRTVAAEQEDQVVARFDAVFRRPPNEYDGAPSDPAVLPTVGPPASHLPAAEPRPGLSWHFLPPAVDLRHDTNSSRTWLRAAEPMPAEPVLAACLVAWASDMTAFDAVAAQWALLPGDPALALTSLDHHLWFHRSLRLDRWLRLDQSCDVVVDGRALTNGSLVDETGRRTVSLVQLGMVRWTNPEADR
jgi:acyl-CoA thioesterase II